jgi:hypothetical protein
MVHKDDFSFIIFTLINHHFFFFGGTKVCTEGFAGALLLESCLQSILLWLFWKWGLLNYLPGLALNWDPLDFNLPGS